VIKIASFNGAMFLGEEIWERRRPACTFESAIALALYQALALEGKPT